MSPNALRELADLIDRAIFDLANGWPEAAADALGRAKRLLRPSPPSGDTHVD